MKVAAWIVLSCCLLAGSALYGAEPSKASATTHPVVLALSDSAKYAARLTGVNETGSITCDAGFFHCTCEGVFDCAWLAWACGKAGGIQGFDGDCFFPSRVPGADQAAADFVAVVRPVQPASCDGIFCSCTGPADSADCKKITGCIDDILCIGDSCGCIGGRVEE